MPLSPKQTRILLDELAHFPNRRLGQNFLTDGNIVRKSIEMADLDRHSHVIEIGPGLGTLTQAILHTGATVWAIERDHTLAEYIRANLLPEQPCLHLIEGDCLDYPRAQCPSEHTAAEFKIVANLPYAISTPWMEAILSGPLPQRMVLMLQKEAAERYVAGHGSKAFGAISIFLQSAYTAQSQHVVSAHCFHPVPKVDSVLLQLNLRPAAVHFNTAARNCIRRIFTRRRKQLGPLCKHDLQPETHEWFKSLLAAGIKQTIRPEQLELKDWQTLATYIRDIEYDIEHS